MMLKEADGQKITGNGRIHGHGIVEVDTNGLPLAGQQRVGDGFALTHSREERIEHVVSIADALRTTYPLNPRMASRWVRQAHRRFGRRSPLAIIMRDGESGLIAVLSELDCTFSWDLTGSKSMDYRPVDS